MFESFKYNDNEFKQKLFLFLLFYMFIIAGQELLLYSMSLISFLNIYESDILGLLATLGLIIVNIAFVVNFMPDKKRGN